MAGRSARRGDEDPQPWTARAMGSPASRRHRLPPGQHPDESQRSLRELGREHVDLVQLHLYWPTWGVDGYWLDELRQLQSSGKILAIGVSVPDYRHDVALELVASGAVNSVQTVVNIFDSRALDCLAPRAAANNVALIARGVLDESGLAGGVDETTDFAVGDFRREFFTAPDPPRIRRAHRRAACLGTRHGTVARGPCDQVRALTASGDLGDRLHADGGPRPSEHGAPGRGTLPAGRAGPPGDTTQVDSQLLRAPLLAGRLAQRPFQAAGMSIGAKRRANRHSPSSRTSSSS